MTNHFTVIKRKGNFVVRYNPGKIDVASYPSYLRAKFREYMGNRNINKAEAEFGRNFGMEAR
jgi:hypothetical protein